MCTHTRTHTLTHTCAHMHPYMCAHTCTGGGRSVSLPGQGWWLAWEVTSPPCSSRFSPVKPAPIMCLPTAGFPGRRQVGTGGGAHGGHMGAGARERRARAQWPEQGGLVACFSVPSGSREGASARMEITAACWPAAWLPQAGGVGQRGQGASSRHLFPVSRLRPPLPGTGCHLRRAPLEFP